MIMEVFEEAFCGVKVVRQLCLMRVYIWCVFPAPEGKHLQLISQLCSIWLPSLQF